MALREVLARFGIRVDGAKQLTKTGRLVDGLKGGLGKLGLALGAGVLARGAKDFIRDMINVGDELDKMSQVTGLSTESLQAWRHAANLSGVASGEFTAGLLKFSKNIFEASKGTALQAEAFDDLGVSIEDNEGKLRDSGDVLFDTITALSGLESQTEKVGQANRLFGRSGAKLLPLLNLTGQELRDALGELDKFGGGLDDMAIKLAAQSQDALARFDLALLSLKSRIVVDVLPAVESIITFATKMSVELAKVTDNTNIFKSAAAALAIGLAVAFAGPLASLAIFGVAVIALALIIDDLWTFVTGGESAFGDAIDAMFGDGSQEKLRNFGKEVADVQSNIEGMIGIAKGDVLRGLTLDENQLDQPLEKLTFKIRRFFFDWAAQTDTFPGALSRMSDTVGDILEDVGKDFEKGDKQIRSSLDSMVEALQDPEAALKEWGAAHVAAASVAIDAIDKWATETVGSMESAVDDFADAAVELGEAIIDGIIEGIEDGAKAVGKAIKGLAKGAIKAFKGKDGVDSKSPSKVFTMLGETIPQGLVRGIDKDENQVAQAMTRTTNRIINITGTNISTRTNNSVNVPGAGNPMQTGQAVAARLGKRDTSNLEGAFNALVDQA